MKKNKIYILAAAAAIFALAGCTKDPGPTDGGEITVEASIGATKVSTVGDNSAFEANDRIAVYAWTGGATAVPDSRVVDGVVNTLGSDGKWTPATKMIWGSMTTPHYFLGISPVPAAIADFTAAPFTLDPSSAAYTASDLLVATNFGTGNAGLTAAGGAVLLAFDHVMAKLNVNLKFRSEWDTTPAVSSVTVTAKTAATVNYLTKTATVDATAAAGEVPLNELSTPATGYGRSYSSLQVPQAFHKITITIAGKEYVFQSTDDIVLAGGRYDRLLRDFGLELAGAGFAVYVGSLASCFEPAEPESAKTLVFYESGCLGAAVSLLGSGAELSAFATEAESLEYARKAGMKLVVVSKSGTKEVGTDV